MGKTRQDKTRQDGGGGDGDDGLERGRQQRAPPCLEKQQCFHYSKSIPFFLARVSGALKRFVVASCSPSEVVINDCIVPCLLTLG